MYQSQYKTAHEAVEMVATGMDEAGRMMAQRTAITDAVTAARTAVGAVNDTADDDQVTAADTAITALETAIDGADDLPEGDTDVATAQGTLATLKSLLASAKTSRTAAMEKAAEEKREAEMEAERKKNEAMAATAAKLYAGISAQMGSLAADGTNFAANDRDAAYNADGTAINLSIGGETAPTALTATLSEDKKATVADLHGWEGKRYTHSVTTGDDKGDMYEAIVYSDVGEPTPGDPFDEQYSTNFVVATGLPLMTDGSATADFAAGRVASSRFDQSAGTKPFKLGRNDRAVEISGSYHGVAGTYICTVVVGGSCTVTKAAQGFTFGGLDEDGNADSTVDWAFKPGKADALVMSVDDMDYSSYGWWLRTKADGSLTASAFVDDKGTAPTTAIGTLVAGSATYVGGAAGKYALSSSTGGTNDAGHFTARATLEADFEDDEVTGTIDQFIGADGESRDWTVELKKSALFDDGAMIGDPDRTGIVLTSPPGTDDVAQETVWTVGGTAAAAAGEWDGALKDTAATETDVSGVPKIATGTFYSTYGTAGRMVGAFGADKQ